MVTAIQMADYSNGQRPEFWILSKIFEAANAGKRHMEISVTPGTERTESYVKLLTDYGYKWSIENWVLIVTW